MENNENIAQASSVISESMAGLETPHQALTEKYKDVNPSTLETNPETLSLMGFNGYYGLATDNGTFFSVDTNILVKDEGASVTHDISLIISLDGKTSFRVEFTTATGIAGTFTDNKLSITASAVDTSTNKPAGNAIIDLTFSRPSDGDFGITASLAGKITLPSLIPDVMPITLDVKGTTYNNPIPYKMYEGKYHKEFLDFIPIPVMEIADGYTLKYDYESGDGNLLKVPSYTYNMNMYFFSFDYLNKLDKKNYSAKLIMGTSPSKGMVCNNMSAVKGTLKVKSRSLSTLFSSKQENSKTPSNADKQTNKTNEELAEYSGYYPIKPKNASASGEIASNAFVAVEGKYQISSASPTPQHSVSIGISLDGKKSKVYTFDTTMTYSDGTLLFAASEPSDLTSLTFKREYVKAGKFGSLVTISGSINGIEITGDTLLNPVPLTAFGGCQLKSPNHADETLTINSLTEITYKGEVLKDILYVPVMYILATNFNPTHDPTGPVTAETTIDPKKPVLVLSLGTDGAKGLASIVITTTGTLAAPTYTSVFTIPNAIVEKYD